MFRSASKLLRYVWFNRCKRLYAVKNPIMIRRIWLFYVTSKKHSLCLKSKMRYPLLNIEINDSMDRLARTTVNVMCKSGKLLIIT